MDAPHFPLLVGLGNPGREYAETRHNIGFRLLDRVADREGATWRAEKKWEAEIARSGALLLCKPLTYMNLSGDAVRAAAHFYKLQTSQILVALDDLALPLGKLRLRPRGSSGGHNGLNSIIDALGTREVARLRIGIGAAPGEATGHVLGRFALEERDAVAQSLDRALAAIDCVQTHGLEAAMNSFN